MNMNQFINTLLLLSAFAFATKDLSARPAPPDSTLLANLEDSIYSAKPLLVEESQANGSPLEYILPKSPQAAALAKYGDIPVGYATGVPDITIPLYEIRLGGYTLPVSISYHASGIKADEVATCVGLGWALNAGGAVMRTVRGLPDIKELSQERDTAYWSAERCQEAAEDIATVFNIIPVAWSMPLHDTEADRYTYNFAGKSGAFMYSMEDRKFMPLNYDAFSVFAENGGGSSFRIADTDGTDYIFRQQERSGCLDGEGASEVSAWYLTDIHTRFGDISIAYRKFAPVETRMTRRSLRVGENAEYDGHGMLKGFFISAASVPSTASARYRCEQVLPVEIRWNGNRIDFEYAADRKDLGTARLSGMTVRNRDGETVRAIAFDNAHYAGKAYTDGNGAEYSSLRMMLEAVSISGSGKYSFGYNDSVLPPPYRMGECPELRCSTDLWGYYNGEGEFPAVPYSLVKDSYNCFGSSGHPKRAFSYSVAENSRRPDFKYASMLALNEITYPTGGTARLSYELHTPLNRFGGLRIKSISVGSETRTFSYSGNGSYDMAENMMWKWRREFLWGNLLGYQFAEYIECADMPSFPESDSGGYGAFYPEVTETFANGDHTVYRYSSGRYRDRGGSALPPSSDSRQPAPQLMEAALNDEGNVSPILVGRTLYNAQGGKMSEESYEYEPVLLRKFAAGTRVYCPIANLSDVADYIGRGGVNARHVELGITCRQAYGWSRIFRLKSKTVTDCLSSVSTKTDYTYDNEMRTTRPKSAAVEGSDGTVYKTVYEYAFESGDPQTAALYSEYLMPDLVIGARRYCGGILTEAEKTDYCVWNNNVYPTGLYRSYAGGDWHQEYSFKEYGKKGNLKKYIRNTCDTVAIEWDSEEEYPIALRKSGKTVTQYTWKPLFGVASITAANGYTRNFSYDSAGRLAAESDGKGPVRRCAYSCKHGSATEGSGENMVETAAYLGSGDTGKAIIQRDVYDDFGRITDRMSNGINEDGLPVHSYSTYDAKGRKYETFLPFTWEGTESLNAEAARTASQSQYGDGKAFTVAEYDGADRLVFESSPGEAWAGKGKTTEYISNGERDVRLFQAPLGKASLVDGGYYKPHTLYGRRATDEDGHSLTVFTDRLGRKVLERRNGGAASNDTYFIHNSLGQLHYVLSPEYQKAGYKDKYAYEYRYDERGNLAKRILPGCEYEQYWHDRGNRLAFMQDAALRKKGLYRFFLYDRLGRLAVQGTCTDCDRGEEPNTAEFVKNSGGFCNTMYKIPLSDKITNPRLETVNYYDTYGFVSGNAPMLGIAEADFRLSGASANGLPTGSVLATSGGGRIVTVCYYDFKGRATDVRQAYDGKRLTATHTEYSYTGKPVRTKTEEYSIAGGGRTLLAAKTTESEYSKTTDRLIATTITINGKRQTVRRLEYDRLGRLKSDTRGGSAGTVGYGYDLRGWTTKIESGHFSESLHYADGAGQPCYNGNISSMLWRTSDYPGTRGYKFTYDTLDRLTEAVYGEGENLSDKQNRYNEKVLEYTANGSMKRFQRRGRKDNGEYGKIDNLNIKLNGNQLLSVTDDALPANKYSSMNFVDGASEETEYEYNGVGALTKDLNRGLTIEYDNLNNPRFMQFNDGNTILYDYSSDGTLLSKTYGAQEAEPLSAKSTVGGEEASNSIIGSSLTPTILYSGTTEYSGDFIYKDGRLSKVLFPGGYCTFDHETQEPQFHYFTQDHLGNSRAVVSESGEAEQITHYYPFGGTFGDAGLNPALQQYKYNGKELDRVAGLNTYDFGARMYNPLVPTWNKIDQLCETYYHISPYVYCGNNPVKNVDYNGMFYGDYYNENGELLGNDGIHDGNVYAMRITCSSIESYGGAVKVTPISIAQAMQASTDIKAHSGMSSYNFQNARNSFVKLDGTQETRDKIFMSIGDDGNGGDSPQNNMEYGASFDKEEPDYVYFKTGLPPDESNPEGVSICFKMYESIIYYHSHPSGDYNGVSWIQPPSYADWNNANDNNNYVIGMRDKMVYIYNKEDGLYARLPLAVFTSKYVGQ